MAAVSETPILVNPNAGLPRSENGVTVYDIDSDMFAAAMKDMAEAGASLLGGCCGTTPEHIRKMKALCAVCPSETVISSYSHAVVFGDKPVVIGERINPTGKPRFKSFKRP